MTSRAALEKLKAAARILQQAKHAVVFTGAGVSTPSGIPDFRTTGTGLWMKDDPMQVASLSAFNGHPERFFAWLKPLLSAITSAKPNPAHFSIARLENAGVVKAIITQNIDLLHQQAGAKTVLPLHGSVDKLVCVKCLTRFPSNQYLEEFLQQDIIPRCPTCSRYLKPDIVLFEEMLSMEIWNQAYQQVEQSDVILVSGSSLEVYPASSLPQLAVRNGAMLIINTLSTTPMDREADLLLPVDSAEILPLLTGMVLGE